MKTEIDATAEMGGVPAPHMERVRLTEIRIVDQAEQARATSIQLMAFSSDPVMRWLWPEPDAYVRHFPAFVRGFGGRAFEKGTAQDSYAWYLADQYVEISGLPDGRYALSVDQDVSGMLHEISTANNSATGCVEITGDAARDIPCA
jgi:hypothetical protein